MNYWKHSLLSQKKFKGAAADYLEVHRFMDASKLFCFNIRHRILLHNTYGIDLCIQKFGTLLTHSGGDTLLIRDIAAEHCKEDLLGAVPTLNHWFKHADTRLGEHIKPVYPADSVLKEFLHRPLLMSGLKATLMITHSNFGIYLAKELLGLEYALELAHHIDGVNISELLQLIPLKERWQYTPDLKQLKDLEDEHHS